MAPLYTHCPHCGYPAVIRGLERSLRRRCRQCREQYTPEASPQVEPPSHGGARVGRGLTRRAGLRAFLKHRWRSPF